MSNWLQEPCGCVNIQHKPGVLKCVKKCAKHEEMIRQQQLDEEATYLGLGLGSLESEERYVSQFNDGFGRLRLPSAVNYDFLEIGCGLSPYVMMVRAAGYRYRCVERSSYACEWMRKKGVEVIQSDWESSNLRPFANDVILMAHSLEHMSDVPHSLWKVSKCLRPGGTLYLIIPDDSDRANPDHYWFFNRQGLTDILADHHLMVKSFEVRKHIKRENFFYVRADKR